MHILTIICSEVLSLLTRRLRDGLLLEDLDCFTADVAGRHIGAANAAHVTAALEEVRWLPADTRAGGTLQERTCTDQKTCKLRKVQTQWI